MLLPLLAFVFGSLLVTGVTYALTARSAGLNARLRDVVGGGAQAEAAMPDQSNEQAIAFFKRIGERAPQSPKELGKLRLRLIQAGYRGGEALFVFLGIRIAFAMGCFALFMTPLVGPSESAVRAARDGHRIRHSRVHPRAQGEEAPAPHPVVAG